LTQKGNRPAYGEESFSRACRAYANYHVVFAKRLNVAALAIGARAQVFAAVEDSQILGGNLSAAGADDFDDRLHIFGGELAAIAQDRPQLRKGAFGLRDPLFAAFDLDGVATRDELDAKALAEQFQELIAAAEEENRLFPAVEGELAGGRLFGNVVDHCFGTSLVFNGQRMKSLSYGEFGENLGARRWDKAQRPRVFEKKGLIEKAPGEERFQVVSLPR
jgi:hypothetical protein